MTRYFLVLICVLGISVGQILFKQISLMLHGSGGVSIRMISLFAAALALYGGATVLWIWALQGVELSRAYLFMALCFVLVPGMSWYFFDEQIRPGYLFGTALIILGIVIAVRWG